MGNVTGIKTAAGVPLLGVFEETTPGRLAATAESDPNLIPKVQYYKHFDLTDEQLGRTWRYNCWGFTFLPRRYWISEADVDQIIQDNCLPVAPGALRRGDVIRYRDDGTTTHTGRVWATDAAGNCTLVRSKWGSMGEYVHIPLEPYITPYYGSDLAYFRQVAPLKGLGDLWIRDAFNDPGEQFSPNQWESPDILVDAPPYGTGDLNPVFGKVNRVWAMVHNRSDVQIDNAHVRYYWADPFAGFAPSLWKLIPSTPAHPNPTDAFSVPANSSVQAPYVEWTPAPVPGVADPAHQCLLAITFVNDDPCDTHNPNPLVYPFEIAGENNIAARNVHVISLGKGGFGALQLALGVPFDGLDRVQASVRVRLGYAPRLPIFGFPRDLVLPQVTVRLGQRRPFKLTTVRHLEPVGAVFGPLAPSRADDFELTHADESEPLLPRLQEKTVAWRQVDGIGLQKGKPMPVRLEIVAPADARPGTDFYLRVEQEVKGQLTGGYTVVIGIVEGKHVK